MGESERKFPARSTPWVLIVIVVASSGWTPVQAALILAVLTVVALLAFIVTWIPHRA
jgi:hypothetical protein